MKFALLALPALLLLAACSAGPNTAGSGNEFVITAHVDHAGKHSITVYDIGLRELHGAARTWFSTGKHQIHDNYTNDSHDVTVGELCRDLDCAYPIKPRELGRGECVVIHGRIRESKSGKTYDKRPVYDLVVPCEVER